MVSYNIKGLGSPIKRKKLKALHCSIAMLQETLLPEVEHLKLKRDWVEQIYSASHKGRRKRGVAILFGRNVFFNNEKVLEDKDGRYIMVIGTIGDNRFTFMNLYASNEDCRLPAEKGPRSRKSVTVRGMVEITHIGHRFMGVTQD